MNSTDKTKVQNITAGILKNNKNEVNMMSAKRIAVTGMAINTPLGDTLNGFIDGMLAGKSAITNWKSYKTDNIYSKVGADLFDYDIPAKLQQLSKLLPQDMYVRLRHLVKRAPWSIKLSLLLSADAWLDAKLLEHPYDIDRIAVLVAGHNINQNYINRNYKLFSEDPEYIDGLYALNGLDTDHAGSVSQFLQVHGPIYTMGGACASGNIALRSAIDEIKYHGNQVAFVVGSVLQLSPVILQGLAIMGAISYKSFNDAPEKASRPFDKRREGFVPAHGGAVLVLEDYDAAVKRGARIYAEVLGVAAGSDGNHLPYPSQQGQVKTIRRLLSETALLPEQVDYVSAHATSTPLGDLIEMASIKEVFGRHAYKLKINAPKSMLGHTCWSAPMVEAVSVILQMQYGKLHPSINVDEKDEEIDLDICANKSVDYQANICMKTSFGFGGINCVSLLRYVDPNDGRG